MSDFDIDSYLALGETSGAGGETPSLKDWTIPITLGVAGVGLIALGWSMSGRKANPVGGEGADEVLIAKTNAGFAEPYRGPKRNPTYEVNEPEAEVEPIRKRKRSRSWKADPEAMSLYDGHEGLLVRTALIRPPGWTLTSAPVVRGPQDVFNLVKHLTYADQEHLVVLALDNKNRVNAIYESSIGTATGTQSELRSIAKIMTLTGTTSCVIVHNHPSGDPDPSVEDRAATRVIGRGLRCMDMQLLDHMVVGRDGHVSLRDQSVLGGLTWYDDL